MSKHTPVTAADGKTEIFNGPGLPLLVRAVDFNRMVAQRDELLEALQRLLPAYREAVKLWDSNHDDAFTLQAHNAIAKATGEK